MNDSVTAAPPETQSVTIIGAGLAGSEAAWQLARRGIRVRLHEMRPTAMTPVHKTGNCAELVCSNTFRADHLENAVGLLHEEMRRMDSLIKDMKAWHRYSWDWQHFRRSLARIRKLDLDIY